MIFCNYAGEWIRTSVFSSDIREKLYIFTIVAVLVINWPFVHKNWMEFSSLGFEFGMFIYGSSVLVWKTIRRFGKMPNRDSNAVKCDQEKEMVHHDDGGVGVLQNGVIEIAVESENPNEGENKSKEDQCGEAQLPIVCDIEGEIQVPVDQSSNYEACRAEVSGIDGKLSLEEPVGCMNCCIERNELGASETITAQAKESETNGMTCFETEQDIFISLESMKTGEKELETSTSEDVAASIEVTDKIVGIEKKEETTEILLNQNTAATEDLGPRVEDISGIEDLVTSVEDRIAVEALTNAAEDTSTVEDTDKVETAVEHTTAIESLVNTDEDSKTAGTALVEDSDAIEALKNTSEEPNTDYDNSKLVEDSDAVHNKLQRRLEEIADEDKLETYRLPDNLSSLIIYEDPEDCNLPDVQVPDFHCEKQLESYADELRKADEAKYLQHDLLMIQFESASDAATSKSSSEGRNSSSIESEWRNSSSRDSDQGRNSISRDSDVDDYCYNNSLQHSLRQRSSGVSDDTLYEKYKERMHHFDILNYQQMHAVGFPLPQQLTKSRSQRMVSSLRQLSSRRRELGDDEIELQHQKDELETIYVSQTCLTWEALHWQYKKIQQLAASNSEPSHCYDSSAEQFQYFQVLLQRFIENEPYDQGLRSQVYARCRYQLPKLLQVPAVKGVPAVKEATSVGEEEDQIPAEQATLVTASQLVGIVEGAIMTFWDFLKADREKISKKLDMLWRRPKQMDSTDLALLKVIKSCLNKKEARLQELKRRRKCVRQKMRSDISLSKEEATEILLGFIDIKIISRVLKMSRISKDHLRWCEEKLNKLAVSKGKLHRDYSPVFFPS